MRRVVAVVVAVLVLAIIALSVYAAVLSHRLDSARRAAAERRADDLQRTADAIREAQTHADRTRQEIERTHAAVLWRIDDVINSGALDERVCELARAAYDSLVCAADGDTVPASSPANAP